MHTPTYSAYVPHMLSMSADRRPVPPVTRPAGKGTSSPHLCSIPHAHRKAMLRQVYVPCVCKSGRFKETGPTGQRERQRNTFLMGNWLVRVWKLSISKTSSQQGDPRV